MAVQHVHTAEEYDALKASAKLVVVDYSAMSWCSPCRAVFPRFQEYAQRYDAVCIHVDIDELGDLADCQDVTAVPTFKFFKNGQLIDKLSGANPVALEEKIQRNVGN